MVTAEQESTFTHNPLTAKPFENKRVISVRVLRHVNIRGRRDLERDFVIQNKVIR